MGNKLLKVFLPLLVLAAIVLVMVRTKKSIDSMAPSDVKPFEFSVYVVDLIQADLEGKPFDEAKDGYRRIYDIIKTEEFLKTTDSTGNIQPLLPDTTVRNCYQKVFLAYWPAFESMVEGVFKYDWSYKIDQLNIIKNEAVALQSLNGSDMHRDSLTHYIEYVDKYDEANGFVTNISCNSKKKYEELLDTKEAYRKKYPLCNNSNLVGKLDEVPVKAKAKWRSSVIGSVNAACEKSELDDFIDAKKYCENRINEFNKYFSSDKLTSSETTKKLNDHGYILLTRAVDKAILINNLSEFSPVYSNLRDKINAFGSDPDDLKGILGRRYNQLRGY